MTRLDDLTDRWGGRALIVSGVLGVVLTVLHPDQTQPGALADPLWIPTHQAGAISVVPTIVGWLALFARHGAVLGRGRTVALWLVIPSLVAGGVDQVVEVALPAHAADPRAQTVGEVREPIDAILWPIGLVQLAGLVAMIVVAVAFARGAVPPERAWLALPIQVVVLYVFAVLAASIAPALIWPTIVANGVITSALMVWIGVDFDRRALAQRSEATG